jgi:hypothetical protein
MPLYSVVCECGYGEDVFRSLSNYDDLPHHCGKKMARRVCAPMVIADIQPYKSMATGEYVEGRRQHRDHLKRHGLVEVGNEKLENKPRPKTPDLKADIAQAVHQVLG